MKNDYEDIADSIRMLCYEGEYEKARKIYEGSVRCGNFPQLYFDSERYIAGMPKWMYVTWNEEITDPDKINCLVTITQHYIEFMQGS